MSEVIFHITVDFSINVFIPDIKSDLYNFDYKTRIF